MYKGALLYFISLPLPTAILFRISFCSPFPFLFFSFVWCIYCAGLGWAAVEETLDLAKLLLDLCSRKCPFLRPVLVFLIVVFFGLSSFSFRFLLYIFLQFNSPQWQMFLCFLHNRHGQGHLLELEITIFSHLE